MAEPTFYLSMSFGDITLEEAFAIRDAARAAAPNIHTESMHITNWDDIEEETN